jgi:tetratricopeptide (TPR) repeat protein
MNRSGYGEAAGQLTAALELLGTQPAGLERDRIEISLRFNLAFCVNLTVSGAFAATATVDNLDRARELCEKVGDDNSRLGILAALAFVYSNRLEQQKARTFCEQLLTIATRLHDSERIGHAWCWLGFSSLWEGSFRRAAKEFDESCKLPTSGSPKREVTFGNWRTLSRSLGSLVLWLLGYPERATARNAESLSISREIVSSPSDLVATLFWSALLNLLLRNPQTAYPRADEASRLAHEHGFIALVAINGLGRGWGLAQMGQIEEGLSETLRWQNDLTQIAGTVSAAVTFLMIVHVLLAAGRSGAGIEAVSKALEIVESTGTRFAEAELRRLKGELLLMRDDGTAAEAAECFRDAIEVARRQSAKSFELRATVSLARLLVKQGKRDEARAMLAEIYNWFTEGFDPADLQDAKALLDELGGTGE